MKNLWIRGLQSLGNLHRRFLAIIFVLMGPRRAYRITGWGANLIYTLLEPLRIRCEAQCRAALHGQVADADIPRTAARSFVNRARNLTDLLLAPRLLHPATFERYGGRIPQPYLGELLEGQRRRQPTILLTAYIGSFDLLPIFLGYNGIRASAVYLPHSNPGFDAFRRRVRSQSGCEMVPLEHAFDRFSQVLSDGGTIALLSDHHVEEKGIPVKFLGLNTRVSRSVGLLAWRYQANVVVAAIRRLDDTFRFEWSVAEVLYYTDTIDQSDPVEFVTRRYTQALERMVLADPTQYLWAYARWGEEFARNITQFPNTSSVMRADTQLPPAESAIAAARSNEAPTMSPAPPPSVLSENGNPSKNATSPAIQR